MKTNTFAQHEQALLFRARRNEVLSANIANADTPNYKARDLDFADVLNTANLQGVRLKETTGAIIAIGDVRLEVSGETDPCGRMDELEPGLRAALEPDWRGGVCCRVLHGGAVADGMPVTIRPAQS